MFKRRLLWGIPPLLAITIGLLAIDWTPQTKVNAQPALNNAAKADDDTTTLPITQVILFNSGVGHFSRSGEIDGDTQVNLSFREANINDLLKSMTVQDLGDGTVGAVSYDSREPISKTLESFAVNLNNDPSLTQILLQTQGERIEVTFEPNTLGNARIITGTILGVEIQKLPLTDDGEPVEISILNLFTEGGIRAVKLPEVVSIRFMNKSLEAEMQRALEVLSLSHDTQKKSVSIQFNGKGKRNVAVGYVVQTPVWKTSYRLILDKEKKPYLKGWAIVENTTDEDWTDVRMALVSGRPISYKMDLYNPLFVDRPVVEPELFASLRPPAYEGGLGGIENGLMEQETTITRGMSRDKASEAVKQLTESLGRKSDAELKAPSGFSDFGFSAGGRTVDLPSDSISSVQSAASGGKLGQVYQYRIDKPVSLARQKSAMLPIVTTEVGADRLSIYNQNVQPKHPLRGLRFKNSTGLNLMQGPITVFEGNTYAGDSRILDLEPQEERLLAYAIDLGMEVDVDPGNGSNDITKITVKKGILTKTHKVRRQVSYKIVNRAEEKRTLIIEHPLNPQYTLIDTPKPIEETASLRRFQLPVKSGESVKFPVTEEQTVDEQVALTNYNTNQIALLIKQDQISDTLKKQLEEALKLNSSWQSLQQQLSTVQAKLNEITQDQNRIRQNLEQTPKEAEVYKTYLEKLSAQEKEIEALRDEQKKLIDDVAAAKQKYDEYLIGIDG